MNPPRSLAACAGQSTIEFVVFALALVPLMLAVPFMGRCVDLLQAVEQASRYVAFEATVNSTRNGWKTDTQLSAEVRRRFFSHPDAPLKTNDIAGDDTADRNPLWVDAAGHALLDDVDSQIVVATREAQADAPRGAALSAALALDRRNLYTAEIDVTPAEGPALAPFDATSLDIRRRTVLLADAWTAKGVMDVRDRIVGSGLDVYPVDKAAGLVDLVGQLPPLTFDPALALNDWDWDVVPCDRIGGCP